MDLNSRSVPLAQYDRSLPTHACLGILQGSDPLNKVFCLLHDRGLAAQYHILQEAQQKKELSIVCEAIVRRRFQESSEALFTRMRSTYSRPVTTSSDQRPDAPDSAVFKAHHKAMGDYWSKIGEPASLRDGAPGDLMAYILNPEFTGAPPWPNMRQAHRLLRTPDSLIIASDGLSDPVSRTGEPFDTWVAVNGHFGFGMEVCIEVKGLQAFNFSSFPRDCNDIASHWVFSVIEQFGRNVAEVRFLL